MSANGQSTLVFFIPGIMGSSLRYKGPDDFGVIVDEEVWGKNLWINATTLGKYPKRLLSPNVYPGEILKTVKALTTMDLYGSLIDFCTDKYGLSLTLGKDFFLFPYDWRVDNRLSARAFSQLIRSNKRYENSRIKIIAHSMGGIVTRLMLNQDSEIRKRTDLVFQIASPIKGSAKAFITLKDRPEFNKLFDRFWTVWHYLNPGRRAQLLSTLQNFPSIYQLFPPKDIKTIWDAAGNRSSALDSKFWFPNQINYLKCADDVHQILSKTASKKIRCIYSKNHKTYMMFKIGPHGNIIKRTPKASGDGTVICSSAYAHSSKRDLIKGSDTEHNELCKNIDVKLLLKKVF